MSRPLVRYDRACRALAEARSVDEVKDIRDKAVAMAAYAKQAKNRDLEAHAIEIRMRATRRLDQLRQAQKETVGLSVGTRGSRIKGARVDEKPTLASQGIDKNLAAQARVLGKLSDAEFEEEVTKARGAVTRAFRTPSGRNARSHSRKPPTRAREGRLAGDPVARRREHVESGCRELSATTRPIRSPRSVPDTVFPSRRAECRDTYPALVYLTDRVRVIECRDRLQWIVQRRRSVCPDSWRGVSFCRTREALLRCAGRGEPAAMARLRALPERFPAAPQI